MAIAKAEIEAERAAEQKASTYNANGGMPIESQAENGYATTNGLAAGNGMPMYEAGQYTKSAPPPVPPRPTH